MAHARSSPSRESKDTTDGFGQVPRGVLHRRPGVCAFCSWSSAWHVRVFFDLPPTHEANAGGHCFVQSNLDTSSIHLVESNSVGLIHSRNIQINMLFRKLAVATCELFPLSVGGTIQGDGPSSPIAIPHRKTRVMGTITTKSD